MGVPFDFDLVVGGPGFELEGAIGNKIAGAGPLGGKGGIDFTVLQNDVLGDRIPGVMFGELWEVGDGAPEGEKEGVFINCFGADLGEVGNFSLVIFLCVFEEVEHFAVLSRPVRVGGKHALIGENEIVSCDVFAVGPLCFGVEVKGPFGELLVGRPFHSNARQCFAVDGWILDAESFKEGADDIGFEDA